MRLNFSIVKSNLKKYKLFRKLNNNFFNKNEEEYFKIIHNSYNEIEKIILINFYFFINYFGLN